MTDSSFELTPVSQWSDVHKPHASKSSQSQHVALCDKDHILVKSCATLSSVVVSCIMLGLMAAFLSSFTLPFISNTLVGVNYVIEPAMQAFFSTTMEPMTQLNACGKHANALPFSVCKASMSFKLRLTRTFIDLMMCVHSNDCRELVDDCKQYAHYFFNAGISVIVFCNYGYQYLIRPVLLKLAPSPKRIYTMVYQPIIRMHTVMFNSFTAFYQDIALMCMFMYHQFHSCKN